MVVALITNTFRVGPGTRIGFLGIPGPTATDDRFTVTISMDANPGGQLRGSARLFGFTNGPVVMGIDKDPEDMEEWQELGGYADGSPCHLVWAVVHANGVVVSTGSVGGYLWDPTSGLSTMLTFIYDNVGGDSAILNAVRKTF